MIPAKQNVTPSDLRLQTPYIGCFLHKDVKIGSILNMDFYGEIAFNTLHIIESLNDEEYKSGRKLYEDLTHLTFKEKYFNCCYHQVTNFKQLRILLKKIKAETSSNNILPVIHLEVHGNKEGFQLQNDEFIKWKKILDLIRPINIKLNMHLLLSIGACKGGFVLSDLDPSSPAPCIAVLGAEKDLQPFNIYRQYIAFYKKIVVNKNLGAAIDQMKKSSKNFNKISILSPIKLFGDTFEAHLSQNYKGPNYQKTIDRRFLEIQENKDKVLPIYLNKTDKEVKELLVVATEIYRKKILKDMLSSFFMCDIYSENYDRFNIEELISKFYD